MMHETLVNILKGLNLHLQVRVLPIFAGKIKCKKGKEKEKRREIKDKLSGKTWERM